MHNERNDLNPATGRGSFSLKILLCFLLLLVADRAFCQDPGPINTDRPDQSNGVYTLPKHDLQLETGVTYGKASGHYLLHNTMLRYGLLTQTELRLGLDYGLQHEAGGIFPPSVSIKQAVLEQKGVIPAITAVGSIGLPFLSTRHFKPDKAPAELALAFENGLSDQISFSYNLGTFLNGEDDHLHWLATANLGFSPLEKLSFFAEYFADFAGGFRPEHNVDAGLLWLIKNNLQLDLAAGTGIFGGAEADQFVTMGISCRFGG